MARAALCLFTGVAGCADAGLAALERTAAAQQSPAAESAEGVCGAGTLGEGVVLDVGAAQPPEIVGTSADRVLSKDAERWVLWDARAARQVASGRAGPGVDMVGEVLLVPSEAGLDVRSARDGQVRSTIALARVDGMIAGLADDGSYVYVADATSLRAVSLAGMPLFDVPGDHRDARISAQPGALHAVLPARSVVETVSLADGSVTLSPPFDDAFHAWFLDGRHFITATGAWFNVYTAAGAFVRRIAFHDGPVVPPWTPSGGGDGNFVWIANHNAKLVRAYPLDGGAPFALSGAWRKASRRSTSILFEVLNDRVYSLHRLDLRGKEARFEPVPPSPEGKAHNMVASFQSHASGLLALGGEDGTIHVLDVEAPTFARVLGCGKPVGMSGAPGRVAIATADHRLRVFDLHGGRATLLRTLKLDSVTYAQFGLAADGRYLVLARTEYRGFGDSTSTVLAYDLQRTSETEPFAEPVQVLRTERAFSAMSTAASAPYVAVGLCAKGPCEIAVRAVDGSDEGWTRVLTRPEPVHWVRLSPGGTRAGLYQPFGGFVHSEIHERAGRLLSQQAKLVFWLDDELWIQSIGSHGSVRDTRATELGVRPSWKLEVDWERGARSENPAYFLDDQGSVYRTSDFTRIWDMHHFYPSLQIGQFPDRRALRAHYTSSAVAGDQLVVGVDARVEVLPIPADPAQP
ncbi:MAG: hypothetical protein ABW252_04585 [Polyangiales bacterium]